DLELRVSAAGECASEGGLDDVADLVLGRAQERRHLGLLTVPEEEPARTRLGQNGTVDMEVRPAVVVPPGLPGVERLRARGSRGLLGRRVRRTPRQALDPGRRRLRPERIASIEPRGNERGRLVRNRRSRATLPTSVSDTGNGVARSGPRATGARS